MNHPKSLRADFTAVRRFYRMYPHVNSAYECARPEAEKIDQIEAYYVKLDSQRYLLDGVKERWESMRDGNIRYGADKLRGGIGPKFLRTMFAGSRINGPLGKLP